MFECMHNIFFSSVLLHFVQKEKKKSQANARNNGKKINKEKHNRNK